MKDVDYALFILDSEGVVKTLMQGEFLGYGKDEVEGKSFSNLYNDHKPEAKSIEMILKEMDLGGSFKTEKAVMRGDGSEFEAQIYIESIEDHGEITAFVVLMKDKSSKKELNGFSSLVAHELRNSLSTAQGYLEMARSTHKKEDFDEIDKAQRNMIDVITDLVLVSTDGEAEKEMLNLKDVFEEAYTYSNYEKTSYEVEDVHIKAGRSSLMRLLGNLISNSVDHNPGQIHIQVGLLENNRGFYYQDNGKGIIEENRKEAVKRGYTTSEGGGQGLGLYLMEQLADLNGWNVKLTESEDGGARFEIYTENNEELAEEVI